MAGTDHTADVAARLEDLRGQYPEPFRFSEELAGFLAQPAARHFFGTGPAGPRSLLDFLDETEDPSLARIAVVLLSRFTTEEVYRDVLDHLSRATGPLAEAYEPGLWLMDVPEDQVANDIVRVVESTGNPHPLAVLQRPAARSVRDDLRRFVGRREIPLTRLALHALSNALLPDDVDLLEPLARWTEVPDVAALAGLSLYRLGSSAGASGVVAGLLAPDEELRATVYYEFSRFLPDDPGTAGYRSDAPSRPAAEALVAMAGYA